MILFVCEGNVCRSPLAAALLQRALQVGHSPVTVDSAGTRALVGRPADSTTAALAHRAGLDLGDHRGRQLDRNLAGEAGLLIATTRRIRSEAVAIHPPAVQYAFTVRQVARLLDLADIAPRPGESADDLVARIRTHLVRNRGIGPIADPDRDDVVDPHGRPPEVHAQAARELIPGIAALARTLGGGPVIWPV
jgi:low molecular weight protein-tyrosine phosphatase